MRHHSLRWPRRDLVGIERLDDFEWVLRWLRQEQRCDPALYADLIRTPSMQRKREAVNEGGPTARCVPFRTLKEALTANRQLS